MDKEKRRRVIARIASATDRIKLVEFQRAQLQTKIDFTKTQIAGWKAELQAAAK